MTDRKNKGKEILNSMFPGTQLDDRPAFREFSELTFDYLFGEIWSRPGLTLRDRSLVTVSVLVATGKEKQLRSHLIGALSNGIKPSELKEAIIHVAHYSGWPSGMNGLQVLQELADEQGFELSPDD